MTIPNRQKEINAFVKEFFGTKPNSNGHSDNGRANPGGSKLTDSAVLEMIFGEEKRGDEFRDTYHGGYEKHHPGWTNSEAVASILRKIAFYSGNDPLQMDRLIRGSALACAKFDDRRGGSTWLADEIAEAISDTPETYTSPSSSSSYSLSECEDDEHSDDADLGLVWAGEMGEPEPQSFVAYPAIPETFPAVYHGAGGSAKSYLLLDFALHYTSSPAGTDWLGNKLYKRGRLLYVDFELNAAEFNRRITKLAKGMGLEGSIKNLGYFGVGDLSTKEAFARIKAMCKKHNFDTVIIDSVGPALEGDMTAAKDVIGFHRTYITPLRDMGITPVLIDHQARAYSEDEYQGKGAFGSSYKEHLARSVYQLQARGYDEDTGALLVRMRHKKANFTKLEKPFDLWVSFTDDDMIKIERIDVDDAELITERSVGLEQRILSALKSGPGDAIDICARVQGNIGPVRNVLTKLKKDQRVVEAGKEGNAIIYDLPGRSSHSHPLSESECDERRDEGALWERAY